jgi:hypothetical protein
MMTGVGAIAATKIRFYVEQQVSPWTLLCRIEGDKQAERV